MKTKIIEVIDGLFWSKFTVCQWTAAERACRSRVDGNTVLRAWCPSTLFVMDITTGEGAMFNPGGFAPADLRKRQIWASPLFTPFLIWLYQQAPILDLEALPSLVEFPSSKDCNEGRSRQEGPLRELLRLCLRSTDKEKKALARTVWSGTFEDTMPPEAKPTLAEFQKWVGPLDKEQP